MICQKISHYSIVGKGGMREEYQAKDKKLGRDVAIKVSTGIKSNILAITKAGLK